MRKILLSLFFVATLSFARSVDETVAQIRRDYNETNSYKNYDVVTQPAENDSDWDIKKYYRNGDLRKVVTSGGDGRVAETTEYYLKNGQTYFKYFVRKIYYNGVSREDERYYYDEDGELVRFIDDSGEVYEDEDGLDGDYGFYGNQKWED
ncbi:hypothetical protein [Leptotrichia buccalis]|uniref:Uncharacterized protein n=1 Tax=Leptotrichia buccalis (strain ATCC 14201 / DSM 1135 / JCM 12969 / NCTC 10249 / C-1013-b) TaxID=523794 RepID=C7ND96_LEPBD|nr:hypothetical protein [Leptotrichia buccalis]ACV39974.1 hypothetical protein Lebu_2115 [Leptotrichia buccalis C-1013-b]